ncbi:hypothetical protein LOTGIDRAFT_216458 [Lottia gigantea]|uniref:NmrA-like family domain-containing protein 1 n=1 Tax=Lottia gigantea TaxID=225164 RepID=V4ACH4_LOTGI|nr:hypothetical protein LOTGIDRAFT_216458 [Lottia gigantea]ESO92810.1 hypothetical protein LOTGIDRAFT_216458 [Lottia gigantea]
MCDKRIVAVFNTTIPLGEAVARTLAKDTDLHVRAVTSDVTSETALNLKNEGVELCECSFQDVDDVITALNSVDECFIVTETRASDPYCVDNEIKQGRLIADACSMSNVNHVIFSTQIHTQKVKGIQVRPMVTKAEIENYMKDKQLPLSCVMMPCFYQDFFTIFKPERVQNNTYQFQIPMGLTPIDMIDIEDVGDVIKVMLQDKNKFINKTVRVSGDKITIPELAAILNVNLKPKMFREKLISVNDYRERDVIGSKDWANYFNFIQRVDTQFSVSMTKSLYQDVKSFESWVKVNGDWIMSQIAT